MTKKKNKGQCNKEANACTVCAECVTEYMQNFKLCSCSFSKKIKIQISFKKLKN